MVERGAFLLPFFMVFDRVRGSDLNPVSLAPLRH